MTKPKVEEGAGVPRWRVALARLAKKVEEGAKAGKKEVK